MVRSRHKRCETFFMRFRLIFFLLPIVFVCGSVRATNDMLKEDLRSLQIKFLTQSKVNRWFNACHAMIFNRQINHCKMWRITHSPFGPHSFGRLRSFFASLLFVLIFNFRIRKRERKRVRRRKKIGKKEFSVAHSAENRQFIFCFFFLSAFHPFQFGFFSLFSLRQWNEWKKRRRKSWTWKRIIKWK